MLTIFSKSDEWRLSEPTTWESEENTVHFLLETDTEFQASMNLPTKEISVQARDSDGNTYFFEHPALGVGLKPSWSNICMVTDILGMTDEYTQSSAGKGVPRVVWHCPMFFSACDLLHPFNSKKVRYRIAKSLDQRRRIFSAIEFGQPIFTGLILTDPFSGTQRALYIKPYDTSALMGVMSLKNTATALGVPMPDKDSMDAYKSKMLEAYLSTEIIACSLETRQEQSLHDMFVEYGGNDCVNKPMLENYDNFWKKACNELGVPPIKVAMTLGSNVARLSGLIICKLLGIEPSSETAKSVLKRCEEATASWLAKLENTTLRSQGAVDGGRCKNENPMVSVIEGILGDLDIDGCYGNGLLNQDYAIGIPERFQCDPKRPQDRSTLRKMLSSKRFANFAEGLYGMRISTIEPLTFDQTLLISKVITENSRIEVDEETEELTPGESNEVLGEFILLTRELKTAFIGHTGLQTLKNAATNKEWSELLDKIVVDSALYYGKDKECKTYDEYLEAIKEDSGIKFKTNESRTDKRSYAWVRVPMGNGWVDKLLGLRKNYPKSHPMNAFYKVIINSTYGVMASIHFNIGNTVVANNITERARVLCWMMHAALGTTHSITDGGALDINNVNMWTENKSGLHTITHISEPELLSRKVQATLTKIPLGGYHWTIKTHEMREGKLWTCLESNGVEYWGCENNWGCLDKICWEHVCAFFPNDPKLPLDILYKPGKKITGYDPATDTVHFKLMSGQYSFETKEVYVSEACHSQSNYLLTSADGKQKLKARGYETKKDLYLDPYGKEKYSKASPIKQCLTAIKNRESVPAFPRTYNSTVLKVRAWKEANTLVTDNELLPGDTTSKATWVRAFSTSMFKWQTYQQYSAWKKRHERLKEKKGYGLELYFMNTDGSVSYEEGLRKIQLEIYQGKLWITPVNKKDPDDKHPYIPEQP